MTSTEKNIISFFIRHPNYFRKLISTYYSFDIHQLKKYEHFLNWKDLSRNTSVQWDSSILNRYSKLFLWGDLSTNQGVFKDVSLIDKFANKIDWEGVPNGVGYSIASNEGLPWSTELIEKYESVLDFKLLSLNESLPWSELLIDKYRNRWDYESLGENEKLPWSLPFFKKYYNESNFNNYGIQHNPAINGVFEIVEEFHSHMSWFSICENSNLPWFEKKLLKQWGDNISWNGIACNELLLSDSKFFRKHIDRWHSKENSAFHSLSLNEAFPWSVNVIDQFSNCWDWENLSTNPSLPWSIDFIDYYQKSLIWGEFKSCYEEDGDLIILGDYYPGLISNAELPWSIDFLMYYENKLDFEMLFLNSSVWEKAFKPYVNEEIIEAVIRVI